VSAGLTGMTRAAGPYRHRTFTSASMLPRFPARATGAYPSWYAPVPGKAPDALAGSPGFTVPPPLGVQTVSAVERTAKVASTAKIANQTTRPITLTSATWPRAMTSVLILTIW
jgi:hypothetical protein